MNAYISKRIEFLAKSPQVKDSEDLLLAFDIFENDQNKLACCYLLMACESHERKA